MTPRALEDRVAIVTEAGRGLGRLLALELARQGARVLVNHHGTEHGSSPPGDISLASATAWEIHDAGGLGGASAHDTNTPEGAHAAVQEALQRWGQIDIVVAYADPDTPQSLEPLSRDEWEQSVQTHLSGTFHLLSQAWPLFLQQRYGRALTIAPGVRLGRGNPPLGRATAASGLAGMVSALALEGASHNIMVNCVAPPPGEALGLPLGQREGIGVEETICEVVAHLVSEAARTNGALIEVDAGTLRRVAMVRMDAGALSLPGRTQQAAHSPRPGI